MLALPPAPAPSPKRQVLIGTALFVAVALMLVGSLSGLWFKFRNNAGSANWKPDKLVIPEVATNVMWITVIFACVIVQWAVYSAKRADRPHTTLALAIAFLLGLAMLNSQAYVWRVAELPVKGDTAYNTMFYAFTGTVFGLIIVGLVYTAVAAFRSLGGRDKDRELLSGLALYWYFLAAAFSVVWFVVYVTK